MDTFIFFVTSYFVKEMYCLYFTFFVNMHVRLELCLHNNDFIPVYFTCYLTSNIQIFELFKIQELIILYITILNKFSISDSILVPLSTERCSY